MTLDRTPPEVAEQIAELAIRGTTVREIRRQARVGYAVIVRTCNLRGIALPPSPAEKARAHRVKMMAVDRAQWAAWKAEKATVQRVAKQLGVPTGQLSRWARANNHVFWTGTGGPAAKLPGKKSQRDAQKRKLKATSAPTAKPQPPYTWQQYFEQRERDFGAPPFLRKAPTMRAAIEAWERSQAKAVRP